MNSNTGARASARFNVRKSGDCPRFSAVAIESKFTLALTLTLSPEEREPCSSVSGDSPIGEQSPAREKVLPLPGGEGRGEGEHIIQLSNSACDNHKLKRRERRAPFARAARWICAVLFCLGLATHASAQLILSGNENKVDLTTGAIQVVPATAPDSISILDFSTFPPKVQLVDNVPNTVIGPPSNIAITPDRSIALIADSAKVDPADATKWVPNSIIRVLDLEAKPPRVIAQVQAGKQPSGLSITHDGKFALVANRAEGTVTLLRITGKEVSPVETIKVCLPEESASDVAISPDDRLVLVSAQKGGYLAVLRLENGHVKATGQKISAYGQPYRCIITPDGELGLTAGAGFGNGSDQDAITVIDLHARPMRTIHHVMIGAVPESIEISPNGKLLAAVVMNGSNLAPTNSAHTAQGAVEILARRGKTFEKIQSLPVGAIPEGVAFTADGRYLVVQCHPSRELWVFQVKGQRVKDTGLRIKVPGMPSSLRASPSNH